MPPSGYSRTQAAYIGEFLLSCAEALEIEAKENSETFVDALDRELLDIWRYMGERKHAEEQDATLTLTQSFYRRLRDYEPATRSDYWVAAKRAVAEISDQILQIKILPLPSASPSAGKAKLT